MHSESLWIEVKITWGDERRAKFGGHARVACKYAQRCARRHAKVACKYAQRCALRSHAQRTKGKGSTGPHTKYSFASSKGNPEYCCFVRDLWFRYTLEKGIECRHMQLLAQVRLLRYHTFVSSVLDIIVLLLKEM